MEELIEFLREKARTLDKMAEEVPLGNQIYYLHLRGKADGVRLAISFMQRAKHW